MNDRSRKYTNVILTIIAILLAIIAFKPSDSILPTAEAQNPNLIQREERNTQQVDVFGDVYKEAASMIAASLNNIASSNSDIATSLNNMGGEIRTVGTKVERMSSALEQSAASNPE